MFNQIKSLFGQTAIYGLSSILGRVLNFMLVPLHTTALTQAEYGINADVYVIIAFLIVIFTYGLETAFFRFSEKEAYKRENVYATALISLIASTAIFLGLFALFFGDITLILKYETHPEYLWWMMLILAMDSISAIPFAKLRSENRSVKFVVTKLALIVSNVLLNLLFFAPVLHNQKYPNDVWPYFFGENLGVGYIFLANLISTAIMLILLLPEMKIRPGKFQWKLWKPMIIFGLPLMISGLAGVANEMLDRQLLKYMLPENEWQTQVGIYGAVYKLSIFLVLFNQAFRYAAEPFFFGNKQADARKTFAEVMHYFVIVVATGFVLIVAYLDIFKHFIDSKFWEGIYIVPILLAANVFLAINTNLSFWYKLSDRTNQAIYITGFGLLITLGMNFWLIPKLGYEGAAWATLASYAGMMILNYVLGQKFYPIPYKTTKILTIICLAFLSGFVAYRFAMNNFVPQTLSFIGFVAILAWFEKDQIKALKARFSRK